MDVLLVSGRGPDPGSGRAVAQDLATVLADRGHRVRWIDPVAPHTAPARALPSGVERIGVDVALPRFRAVAAHAADPPTERVLSESLRARLPDVVHVLGYGGASSAIVPWISARLGVAPIVAVDAAVTVCHRGTLVDERGMACGAWDQPERCAVCCGVPFDGGITASDARWARRVRFLGRWSPYPKPVDFATRLDVMVAGLQSARIVQVAASAQAELLLRAGVSADVVRVGDVRDPTWTAECYGFFSESSHTTPIS